ncbi:hemicentin-1-like [Liolophura sinensis]|uniref:hemicentin-1-like n=1 Tax=Liolophura sinensis TaxID=3198878 RepID=UPI00315886A5
MTARLHPSTVLLAFTAGHFATAVINTTLEIREHSRVELSCDPDVSGEVSRVTWYLVKTPYIPATLPPADDYVRISEWQNYKIYHSLNKYDYFDYRDGGKFTLVVKNVTSTTNIDIYCCFVNENTNGQCFQIDIIVPVKKVVLVDARPNAKGAGSVLDVTAGNDTLVTCLAPRANPAPDFSWSVSGRPLSPGTIVQNCTNSVTIRLEADRAMTGKNITCTAMTTDGIIEGHHSSATASLNVLFPPTRPALTTVPPLPVEGSKIVLSCRAEGNPTPSLSLLTPDGLTLNQTIDDETYGDYRFSQISRRDRGMYQCTASNTHGHSIDIIKLDVLYAPDVNLTFDNTTERLECSADGNPTDYIFEITQSLGGKIIKRWRNHTVGKEMTVDLSPFGMDRTGLYVCNVDNGVGAAKKSDIYVHANTKPRLDYIYSLMSSHATLQGKGILRVLFYAYPPYTSLSWSRMEANTSVGKELYHYEDSTEVLLYVDGVLTRVPGTSSTLFLSHVTPEDLGLYNFRVENSEGEVSLQLTLSLGNNRLDLLPPFVALKHFLVINIALFGTILGTAAIVFGCTGLLKISGLSVKVLKRRKDRLWWPMKRLSSIYYTWSGNPPSAKELQDMDNRDPVYYQGPLNSRFRLSTRRQPINSVLSAEELKVATLPPACGLEMSYQRSAQAEEDNNRRDGQRGREERGREDSRKMRGNEVRRVEETEERETEERGRGAEERRRDEPDFFPGPCVGGYYAPDSPFI